MNVALILVIICYNVSNVACENIDNTTSMARKQQGRDDLLRRILPMLAMPFITQLTLLPIILFFMKMTLLNSMFLGKFAIILWSVNWLRSRILDGQGGLYSHNVNVHHGHY